MWKKEKDLKCRVDVLKLFKDLQKPCLEYETKKELLSGDILK